MTRTSLAPLDLPTLKVFEKGFFHWAGGHWNFEQSKPLYYSLVALVALTCILLWLFRSLIRQRYEKRTQILGLKKTSFWTLFGTISLICFFGRLLILFTNGFPNYWEIIPLHYCRLFIFLVILSIIFNRFDYSKYYCIFAYIGALIAFSLTDLANNEFWQRANHGIPIHWGLDSFAFWDFFFAHAFLLIMSTLITILGKQKVTKTVIKDSLITMILIAILVFSLNYLTTKITADVRWHANWFYMGIDQANSQKDSLGILTRWPYHLFLYIGIFIIFYFIGLGICFLGSKIGLYRNEENKISFFVQKSQVYADFKQSKWIVRH
ncbi:MULTISPECIES: YwaF family protein [unclassified Mycoplasma]